MMISSDGRGREESVMGCWGEKWGVLSQLEREIRCFKFVGERNVEF